MAGYTRKGCDLHHVPNGKFCLEMVDKGRCEIALIMAYSIGATYELRHYYRGKILSQWRLLIKWAPHLVAVSRSPPKGKIQLANPGSRASRSSPTGFWPVQPRPNTVARP
jgi:hypothetical protein